MTAPTDLQGKTVLVTGGGAGIGRGVSLAAARAGARVVVTSRHDDGAETAELAGNDAVWVRMDVTDQAQVEAAFAVAGAVDGVVHNATSNLSNVPARLVDVTIEEWQEHAGV